MRMFTVDKSTGPGLEDRRTRLWKHADVGVNRFTELDLDLPEIIKRRIHCHFVSFL